MPSDNSLVALVINPGDFDTNMPSPDEFRALGNKWIRFLPYATYQNYQTGQNTDLDAALARCTLLGINVLVLLNPETVGTIPPPHNDSTWGDANSGYIGKVSDLAAKMATFYHGKIGAIEIFNEPDVMEMVPEDYAKILQASYAKIKVAVTDVPVVSAGICCGQAYDYLTRVLKSAPNSCDHVGWHPYGQRIDGFPSSNWGIGELRDSLTRARAIAGKPLWITEIGADLKYSWPNLPSPEQGVAEYLTRAYVLMRSLGVGVVARAFWFTWKHPDGNYGMVDNAGNHRAAWTAFQQQAQYAPPSLISIQSVAFSPVSLNPNDLLNVSITVKNESTGTIPTQTPAPGFVYEEGDTFYSRGFPDINSAYRVGIDFDGRTGVDHPYRWGLGAPLAPGQTATVTGAIRLHTATARNYWAGLVQEQVTWAQDVQGRTLVSVAAGTNVPPRIDQVQYALATVNQQTALNVSITVTNPGTAPLPTMAPNPGFAYNEGDNFYTRNFPEIPGAYRVGLEFDGNPGIDHPYRWGLGTPLQPGETRVITGSVILSTAGTINYWVGLVQEQVKWIQDKTGVQPVTITDPFTGTVHIVSVAFTPAALVSDQLLGVSVTVRNDSSVALATQAPDPGTIYEEGDTFYTLNYADVKNAYRVAVDFDGRDGVDHPYRWGLGSPLAPGETRVITGGIRLKTAQSRNFWAGLVQEQVAWREDGKGKQPITVVPPGEPHIVSASFTPASLNTNDLLSVSIVVQNNSAATIQTQLPDPGLAYQQGDSFYTRGFPDIPGAVRVGVDFDGRTGIDHPHRWGLGSPLGPGESRTITGTIQLAGVQAQNFWAGVVEERVAWLSDRVGVTPIQVTQSVRPSVVHAQNGQATTWINEPDYWNYVNQSVVDDMVARGILQLTGAPSVGEAWQAILPRYQFGQGIAIKVNFTNDGKPGFLNSVPQTLNAILRGLTQMGVHPQDVWVYDNRSIPDYYVQMCRYPGVQFFDGAMRGGVTFNSGDPSANVAFTPPSDVPPLGAFKITDILVNATYLINLPTLKAHVTGAGASLGFKNHQGSINNPSALHAYFWASGEYFRTGYNALVDLNRIAPIRSKTVLTIGDALFTSDRWNSAPLPMQTFGGKTPNSLFFATDPVAIDSVMYDFLDAEWGIAPGGDNYLRLAADLGMGVFERGDPRGAGYKKIGYYKI